MKPFDDLFLLKCGEAYVLRRCLFVKDHEEDCFQKDKKPIAELHDCIILRWLKETRTSEMRK